MHPIAPAKNNLIAGWRRDGAREVVFCLAFALGNKRPAQTRQKTPVSVILYGKFLEPFSAELEMVERLVHCHTESVSSLSRCDEYIAGNLPNLDLRDPL